MNHNDMKRNNGMRDTMSATRKRHAGYGHLLRMLLILIVMITGGVTRMWGQDEPIVEITSNDDRTNGTEKLYLIAMCSFNNFYMSINGTNVNTSNVPSNATLWYFLNAGTETENDETVQYYYIVSKSSGKYINNSDYSTSGRTVTLANYDSNKDDQFRFKIVENTTSGTNGFYNINIKPNGSEWIGLNKRGGNISTDNVRLTNDDSNHYINDGNSKWKFIRFSHSEPIVWNPPFTLSNNDSKSYYRITNRSTSANNISYNTSTLKATVSTVKDENSIWYFEEATSYKTDFITYYYIVNNSTGKYLYYNSSASSKVEIRDKVDNDVNYLFIVTQAAFDSPQSYDIYPKAFEGTTINANNCIGNNNTGDLQIINGRTQNGARWIFEEVQQVAKPVIQYDATQNAIIITSATDGATIYYTTAADEASLADPSPSTGITCNSGELLQNGVSNKYIKAIAVKENYVTSEVSDLFSPVTLRCATPVFTKSGDNFTISCDFPDGASIFYTTNGDTPTSSSNLYSNAISVSTGDIVKAIAIASGYNDSEVATLLPPAYTYNIVDTEGHIAIKYTVNQYEGTPLSSYTDIPEAIRSPYLESETVTFYSTLSAEGSRANLSGPITSTPTGGGDIYVSYTTDHLNAKPLHLSGTRPFKMQVNGEYIYDNKGALRHSASDGGEANTYLWKVAGNDPYRVQIQNLTNTSDYFTWSSAPSASLTLNDSPSNFIIFGGSVTRPDDVPEGFNDQVELMAATGEDISSNAYYNVGLDSDVGLLASSSYGHGHAAIQVLLKAVTRTTTFHIIDMSGHIVVEQSGNFDALEVPEQWQSPLVQAYHFWTLENLKVTNGVYTLRLNQTEIGDFASAPAHIYVTYDPSDTYDLDGSENRATDGKKYLLKFAGGTSFNQEKSDGFEPTAAPGIYPYINGDGGLFVYGQAKLDATAEAVGSTRTRWAWYLEGGDPYRLRISTLQTRTDGNLDETLPRYSYLRTYMPKGYDKVVTGVISNNPEVDNASDDAHAARHKPTDYMILKGTNGHFRLVTSDVVDDLDGNTANDVRHTVTSFENYWKTNPTAANVIHDYDNSFNRGDTPTDAQMTGALVEGKGWHSYNVWAYGSTWIRSSKEFHYEPHWFKTIDVGTEETAGVFNGDFDLVEYELDGALVLLDQHGWEVMRKPITNLSTKKAAYATELRKYDSPMVKKYHFWTNFKKDDGYHKYRPIRGVSSTKDAQHKGEGTSLADYPEVLSTGTLADIYVTYEVMATYRVGYTGAATQGGTSASKYLIRQGTKYAKTTDGSTITLVDEATVDPTDLSSIDDELLWYVKPNFYIDTEMDYHYGGSKGEKSQTDTESDYYTNRDATVYDTTNGQNGFDPYNLQIESAKTAYSGKLFTTNATGAGLDGSGGLESTYSGAKTVTLQTYSTAFNITTNYYDSGTGYQIPQVSNSTFMAVSDANGNIRLMPRFDHHNVVTSFTTLDVQIAAAPYGDESGKQTTLFVPEDTPPTEETISSSDQITDMNGNYTLKEDFSVTKVIGTKAKPFRGTIDGQLYTIDGLSRPLVAYADGATIKNVIVKTASINAGNADGNAGAICCEATGATRIYNCGILPTTTKRDQEGNITGFEGSHVTGSDNVGSIVGKIDGESRVINCFSYANVYGGAMMGGIVGNNAVATTADNTDTDHYLKTMVMNCMFYGNITGGSAATMKPVYGGQIISNAGANGINNYNYYRNGKDITFDVDYSGFADYYCSLPADEEYLTQFEYYRSIFNSNRKLCVWWITGHNDTEQTAEDGKMMAKWVLDREIAPYPILKKWGKYPSVINQDKEYVWNPKTEQKVSRTAAEPYQGKQLGTISVTVNAGAKHAGTGATSTTLTSIIMDMDTLNHDYCYAKIQLPYYNELFGDPAADAATEWDKRYGGNYKDYVVTGWKITSITGGTPGSFKGYAVTSVPTATSNVSAGTVTPDETSTTAWEDGFNFADRKCTNKDLYSKSGRVFAQGGYYYVPEGVTAITIEAYWGKAVYLHNNEHSLDRVNVANVAADGKDGNGDTTGPDFGSAFTPAGTLSATFQTYPVKDNLQDAITALTNNSSYTVYDQAIVLVGNVQVKNRGGSLSNGGSRAFTIMSCDLDLDNEPDYCLQFQQRNTTNRPSINPARFDFLPVPELGLAIRTNTYAYAIGIMVPKGHFEITETAFMHTTQFEYDSDNSKTEAPLILNGGHFEQIVLRRGDKNKTSYILMGGNFRMKRFTPGYHATPVSNSGAVRHCAVNAIGGEYSEFYLSGIYRPDLGTLNDNPHCYTNGGYFGLIAGAGYEQVKGDVTFKIDHSIIDEFYGGGINAAKPVTGQIDVEINNSLVGKYCGGPKVGEMSKVDGKLKTVTTNATGTTFGVFYGGGNGGTSYYRESKYDNTGSFPAASSDWWGFTDFNPLNQTTRDAVYKYSNNENWGYHAEYEFEVFNSSNGLMSGEDVLRCYYRWAQFGTTTTGDVTSTLTDCTITGDFFGGGNLANVTGKVTSILKGNTHVNGSVFGGGYSASIPSFPVHDKNTVSIPTHDAAGNVDEQGSLDYYQDGGKDRMYTWCYKNAPGKVFPEGVVIPADASTTTKQKSVFRYPDTDDGKWYVLTTESLEGLGSVSGDATVTLDDDCVVEGNVYGGGDASIVKGSTTVNLQGNTHVLGNVFGGGNVAEVTGSATVNIRPETPPVTPPVTPDPEP